MTVKIICIEEHTLDGELATATRSAEAAQAGYQRDLAGAVQATSDVAQQRPQLVFDGRTPTRAPAVE